MFLFIIFPLIVSVKSAPASPGPDFQSIQYLHNINLTYFNNTLEGLDTVDKYSDVDAQMAASLKDAIHRALPEYMSKEQTTHESYSSNGSLDQLTTPGILNARVKRASSLDIGSTTTSSAKAPGSGTTQPYGTDEEFYARTDLVHFQINIESSEGSGAGVS